MPSSEEPEVDAELAIDVAVPVPAAAPSARTRTSPPFGAMQYLRNVRLENVGWGAGRGLTCQRHGRGSR